MTKSNPKPVEPRLVAIYGGVASTLRQAMQQRQLSVPMLNELLGIRRDRTTLYPYLRAESAPGPELRAKLAAVLDVPESALMAAGSQPAQALVAVPKAPPSKPKTKPALFPHATVTVVAGQQVRLVLDQIMPAKRAAAILMLLAEHTQGDTP